uniref:Putative secreted protein n=1 Tax=Rhipicephalus microplus TaxID=6941 RepID=A0A6G5A4G8_RHIMP
MMQHGVLVLAQLTTVLSLTITSYDYQVTNMIRENFLLPMNKLKSPLYQIDYFFITMYIARKLLCLSQLHQRCRHWHLKHKQCLSCQVRLRAKLLLVF